MPDGAAGQAGGAGQIVTFYSFKGGTGRTMALANVAWILAANGKRVLVADWDLESPGLHRFFQPFLGSDISGQPGVVDFIRRYEWAGRKEEDRIDRLDLEDEEKSKQLQASLSSLISEHVNQVDRYALPVEWQLFSGNGAIHFLGPGKQGNGIYEHTLSALDWDILYDHFDGGVFFDNLRTKLKKTYDYVLIDSRTGLSDIPDICTLHLPDVVVDCFTLSTQGIEGAATIARLIQQSSERDITIYPVPMRIDPSQPTNVAAGLHLAAGLFEGLPAGMTPYDREQYWDRVKVPYLPSYAYEETLAAFGDRPGDENTLLPAYQRIAGLITGNEVNSLPPLEEWLRLRTRLQFTRTVQQTIPEVVVQFSPQDQLWAEWIAAVLAGAAVYARLAPARTNMNPAPAEDSRVIAVASESYFAAQEMRGDSTFEVPPELLVCVNDVRVPLGEIPVLFLDDLTEDQAADLLIERLGGQRPAEYQPVAGRLRYPGGGWNQVSNVPARNANFTGRDAVLSDIREQLRSHPLATSRPLTIVGVGGVGKTQVALEYAQRFKADYDIVWWVNCTPPQYIDSSLADLAGELRAIFDVSNTGNGAEAAQQVLTYLSKQSELRWLLVYDNAEDEEFDAIEQLMPQGGGHVLITARANLLASRGPTVPLSVFLRTESVDHLRQRMPEISESEARELAEVLGDVPLAVATAGALLASEHMTVPDYLELLDRQEPGGSLPSGGFPPAAGKAWHLSLDRLERKSPAAARLLKICSVMAPVSSFDLIVSDAMVNAVQELDPSITDRVMINLLIEQIDQLALIKVDQSAKQMQVHQVVQEVVRSRMYDADEFSSARREVHQILVSARPPGDIDDPAMWPGYRTIWPHLAPSQAHLSTRPQVRDLLIDRVRYLWLVDNLERGRRRAEEVQHAWTAMLTEQQKPSTTMMLRQQLYRLEFNLANILRGLGLYGEARDLDEAVLKGQEELLGRSHQYTLMTRSGLAADLRALGDYYQALALAQETCQLWEDSSGFAGDYPLTLSAAHDLALSYLLTGGSRQALRYDLQTLERRTRAHANSRSHPRLLASKSAVGRDLLEAGRYEESVHIAQEVLSQAHEAYGDGARITLNSYLWLGIAQRCAGDAQLARENIETATDGLSRNFGSDSSDALAARLSQALNYLDLGQIKDGRANAENILLVYQRRLGLDHPYSLVCQLNVATAMCLEEEWAAARPIIADTATRLENCLGSQHPYTLAAKLIFASALAQTGELPEAEQIERYTAMSRSQVLGARHPDTLRCRANLLLTQAQLGEDSSAEADHMVVINELSAQLGRSHPDVQAAAGKRRLLCRIDAQPF